jgi:hypothetical protein
VYVVNDPSSNFRASNVKGVPTVNVGNIEAYVKANGGHDHNAVDSKVGALRKQLGVNEASHAIFLEKYPALERTDLRPLRDYPGNSRFKQLPANAVWEFFSDVASVSVDPLRQISASLNPRKFDEYKLSEMVSKDFLRRQGFTDNDIDSLNKINTPRLSKDFERLFDQICNRLKTSSSKIGELYKREMIAQGRAINQYLLTHPGAFSSD